MHQAHTNDTEVQPSAAATQGSACYPLSATLGAAHEKWVMHKNAVLFKPDADQLRLMAIVAGSLDAGVFYSSDMLECVERQLCAELPADYKSRGTTVEGGVLGMETYYARHAVKAQRQHAKDMAAVVLLQAGDTFRQVELFLNGKTGKWNGTIVSLNKEYCTAAITLSQRGSKNRYSMTVPATHKTLASIVADRTATLQKLSTKPVTEAPTAIGMPLLATNPGTPQQSLGF